MTDLLCEYCSNKATHIEETDPYAEEIHNDMTLHNMCDKCFRQSMEDI